MYGVRPNGVIYGEKLINRQEMDMLFHAAIDEALKRIIPNVGTDIYMPYFHDVFCDSPEHEPHELRTILEIKVDGRNGKAEIYEDANHNVCVHACVCV